MESLEREMEGESLSERSDSPKMIRREFLLGTVKASLTFLAASTLPLPSFGAEAPKKLPLGKISLTAPPDIDYSLNILAAYLAQYAPPSGAFPDKGDWTAVFEQVRWDGSASYGKSYYRRNAIMGSLALTRRRIGADEIQYKVASSVELSGGREDTIEAEVRCADKPLFPLLQWKSRFRSKENGKEFESLAFAEDGSHADGWIAIRNGGKGRRIAAARPVVSQWTLLDAVRHLKPSNDHAVSFDMLQDLWAWRPDQRIAYAGKLKLALDDAKHELHGFVQTGQGVEPTHYWLDKKGRPLLVTYGMLGLGLKEVRAERSQS